MTPAQWFGLHEFEQEALRERAKPPRGPGRRKGPLRGRVTPEMLIEQALGEG